MNNTEKQIICSAILRLADDEVVLTPDERRDVINELCHGLCDMSLEEILSKTQNNRKLRIKRGDKTKNDEYTGLAGEITMDLDNKTVRIHDGETAGGCALARATDIIGDYVIETQLPTAENSYTWYRKYKSGWVEQGGETTEKSDTVILPISMADSNYTLIRTQVGSSLQSYYPAWVAGYLEKTDTYFKFECATSRNTWFVCGTHA